MSHQSALDVAPSFELPDAEGTLRSLDEFLKTGPVFLAFHRGTW